MSARRTNSRTARLQASLSTWRFDRAHEPRRWARRLGVTADEHDTLVAATVDEFDMSAYLFGREAGLTREQVEGLIADGVDVHQVASAVWLGLDPNEALLVARMMGDHFDSYDTARRTGLTPTEVLELWRAGIDLNVYATVIRAGGTIDDAITASELGVPERGYRVCDLVGLTHQQILDHHLSGDDLCDVALRHRRNTGERSELDWLIERWATRR